MKDDRLEGPLRSIMNNSDADISLGDDVTALGKKLH